MDTATSTDPKGLFRSRDIDDATPTATAVVAVAAGGWHDDEPAILRAEIASLSFALAGQGLDLTLMVCSSDHLQVAGHLDRSEPGDYTLNSWVGRPEVVAYWLARHTSTDSYEKRGVKPQAVILVDRKPAWNIAAEDVHAIVGDRVHEMVTAVVFAELAERWSVHIVVAPWALVGTRKSWQTLAGDTAPLFTVDALPSPEQFASMAANLIGATS